MIHPFDLKPVTVDTVYDNVAKKMNIKKDEVIEAVDAFYDFLNDNVNETNNVCYVLKHSFKMRFMLRKARFNKDFRWVYSKIKFYRDGVPCDRKEEFSHKKAVHHVHGVELINAKLGKNSRGNYEPFTLTEVARIQNDAFFKEDLKYMGNSKVRDYMMESFVEQKHIESFFQDGENINNENIYKSVEYISGKVPRQR